MKNVKRFICALIVFVFSISVSAYADDGLTIAEQGDEAAFFEMVFGDALDIYQYDVKSEDVLKNTVRVVLNKNPEMLDEFLRGFFESLDDYSEFYSPDEYKEFLGSVENITGGIGAYLSKNGKYITVSTVVEGGGAADAGIMQGDEIFSVDGVDITAFNINYALTLIKGEIGTTVKIGIIRNGEEKEFTVTRKELNETSVNYVLLTNDTAYIAITGFSSTSSKEFDDALDYVDSHGVKKIILDLRNNPGGYVDQAVEIAKRLVPKGPIISHKLKFNEKTVTYNSDLKYTKYKLVTLVNEYTASASEILASALSESGVSKLVGYTTFGKAVTQNVFGLYGGRYCKLTTGEYLTRRGHKINKVGITPDYTVTNETVKFEHTDAPKPKYASRFVLGDSDEIVYGYKLRLDVLGYDVGSLDNEYDEKMKNAVYGYQTDAGMEPTGELDVLTQINIVEDANDTKVVIDNQLYKACELIGTDYKWLKFYDDI